MSYETILVERLGPVGRITLNRPDVLNAINNEMISEIDSALTQLEGDPEVKVLVFTGAGRAFSAGRDINEIGQPKHRSGSELWSRLQDIGKPVIAAVNGLCYTGALSMILCFDLIVAVETAVFADTHARFGMRHGGGSTQRLRDLVGPLKAKEILLTCQPLEAVEAFRIGLVNRVVPREELDNVVFALAESIAKNDAETLKGIKMLINQGTTWGTAVGLELEQIEYRKHRQAISAGNATIEISTE